MRDVKAGVYRHYKGPLYQVFGLGHDANADEFAELAQARIPETDIEPMFPDGRDVIVYIGLQLDEAHTGPRLAIRTARDIGDAFYDEVHMGNPERFTEGTVCDSGCTYRRINNDQWGTHKVVPRFEYLGPTWDGAV